MGHTKRKIGMDRDVPNQQPRLKVWLEIDGDYSFGYGVAEILQAVANTESIKHAAAELGKSYRYVWGRIKAAEQTLGRKLVDTQVGGRGNRRSCLTDFARATLNDFMTLRHQMVEMLQREFSVQFDKSHGHAD